MVGYTVGQLVGVTVASLRKKLAPDQLEVLKEGEGFRKLSSEHLRAKLGSVLGA